MTSASTPPRLAPDVKLSLDRPHASRLYTLLGSTLWLASLLDTHLVALSTDTESNTVTISADLFEAIKSHHKDLHDEIKLSVMNRIQNHVYGQLNQPYKLLSDNADDMTALDKL